MVDILKGLLDVCVSYGPAVLTVLAVVGIAVFSVYRDHKREEQSRLRETILENRIETLEGEMRESLLPLTLECKNVLLRAVEVIAANTEVIHEFMRSRR